MDFLKMPQKRIKNLKTIKYTPLECIVISKLATFEPVLKSISLDCNKRPVASIMDKEPEAEVCASTTAVISFCVGLGDKESW